MLIPILAGLATLFGGGTLVWYYSLSDTEKKEADGIAEEYASQFYGVAVDQLTTAQADHVHGMVKRHFDN